MRRPKIMIAMGLLPVAVFGGLMLQESEGAGSAEGSSELRLMASATAALPVRNAAAPEGGAGPVGGLCGPVTEALRCRSSD